MNWIYLYFLVVNIFTFGIYAWDKHRAKKHKYRISEKTLIGLAVIGGSVGALSGMYLCHHKTRKPMFFLGVPMIFIIQVVVCVLVRIKL